MRQRHLVAVLQVHADAGQIDASGDAVRAQVRGRTDPRQHQQLRRVEGSAAQDDLAPRVHLARLARVRARFGVGAIKTLALAIGDAARDARIVEED